MSETNSTGTGSAPEESFVSELSLVLGLLEETFADLGIDATPGSDVSGRVGLFLKPLEPDQHGKHTNTETINEAPSLISRIHQGVGTRIQVSLFDEDTRLLFRMSALAQCDPDPGVREVASRISALIGGLRSLDIAVKQDDYKFYFDTSASATGEAKQESQRLICLIGRGDPPPTTGPSSSVAPTAD